MILDTLNFGVLDNRFLAKSLGLLDPPPPVTVAQSDPLRKALELLEEHKIGCVTILDAESKIAGIFSERDVILKVVLKSIDFDKTPISEVMTARPTVAHMTTPIAYALNMMSQGGFRHLPIVDDENYPVGIVSVKNIIDFIVRSLVKDIISLDVHK
jgi:CBS domain-containing protein